MTLIRLLVPAAMIAVAAPAAAEVCVDRPGGQYTDNAKLCVSSVLKPQGANTYGPEHLNGESAGAWCEGAPGAGKGEYIRILFSGAVRFRTLMIGNGYTKSSTAFFSNARARTVRVETSDGLKFAAEIKDSGEMQSLHLPRVVRTTFLRFEIVDVYAGDRHQDLCMTFLWPNFEEMDRGSQ